MAHINLHNDEPGIVGLFAFRRDTASPMGQLAELLLRGPSTLSSGEREIIASYVSALNGCNFCHRSHGAAAAAHLGADMSILDDIRAGMERTPVSPRLRILLRIAAKVQQGGKSVTKADVDAAKDEGATDLEIHDTVLIAAAFCMYNRYVDGMGTSAPDDLEAYRRMGVKLAQQGYVPIVRGSE